MSSKRLPVYENVKFLVEATSYERTRLTLDWKDKVDSWEEVHLNDGPYPKTIGKRYGRPITIWFWWVKINGHLIGFYSPESELVDYKFLEEWLDKHVLPPVYDLVHRVDASNFKNCLVNLGIPWKPFK